MFVVDFRGIQIDRDTGEVRTGKYVSLHDASLESSMSLPTTTSRGTRREISQALAKALAYRDCGKPEQSAAWAAKLVRMLEAEHILLSMAQ